MTPGPMALATIRRRLSACLSALAQEHWAFATGRSRNLRTTAIFESFADLARRETFELAGAELARAGGDPEEARRHRHLREGLALFAEERRVAPVEDALATRNAPAGSPPASEPLERDRICSARAAAGDLGYGSYEAFFTATSGIDLDRLVEMIAPLRRRAGEQLATLVAPGEDATPLFRAAHFDPYFPAGGAAPLARTIVERDLGLDLAAGGRLRLDLDRDREMPRRAFTAAIQVPEEIHLVARPAAGADAYAAFFHELGHALHLAHVDPAQPFEYRQLGDSSVTEGFAALFEGILRERPFAERRLGAGAGAYLEHAARVDLWMLSRYAAKLDYERELWRAPDPALENMAGRYAAHLEAATHLPADRARYLSDVDLHFHSARYLRAWLLRATLRRELKADFGEAWFESRRAGRYLREIWAYGQKWNAEELGRELGAGGLEGEPLSAEIEKLAR